MTSSIGHDEELSIVKMLAQCTLNVLKDDEQTTLTPKEINDFIWEHYPLWRRQDKMQSVKDDINRSIEEDPWNPLFSIDKFREVVDKDIVEKVKTLQKLREVEMDMYREPMAYKKADWARMRLKKKLLTRKHSISVAS
jgi:hypothetical protein